MAAQRRGGERPPPSVDGDVPSSADANPQLKTATLTLESRTMMARKLIGQTISCDV